MSIQIKKIETADELKGKAFVHWQCWHDTYPGLVDQGYLDSLTLEKCEKIAFQWPDNLLAAMDGDRVVGFIGYGVSGEADFSGGEIFALYVLKKYRGMGIGRKLVESGLDELSDHSEICLWALKENAPALRFYERLGFRPDGKEKFSATVGAAGVRMTLKRRGRA